MSSVHLLSAVPRSPLLGTEAVLDLTPLDIILRGGQHIEDKVTVQNWEIDELKAATERERARTPNKMTDLCDFGAPRRQQCLGGDGHQCENRR